MIVLESVVLPVCHPGRSRLCPHLSPFVCLSLCVDYRSETAGLVSRDVGFLLWGCPVHASSHIPSSAGEPKHPISQQGCQLGLCIPSPVNAQIPPNPAQLELHSIDFYGHTFTAKTPNLATLLVSNIRPVLLYTQSCDVALSAFKLFKPKPTPKPKP